MPIGHWQCAIGKRDNQAWQGFQQRQYRTAQFKTVQDPAAPVSFKELHPCQAFAKRKSGNDFSFS
jgi:hypothetical protein